MAQSAPETPAGEIEVTRESAMRAFEAIRAKAAIDFPNGISLEEINEEIRKVRYGEDSKPAAPTLHP